MNPVVRTACRALLLTPQNEILLIKISNPGATWAGWITPGGGLDAGESEVDGLCRELREELGLFQISNPVKIWNRFHKFIWNDVHYEQSEVYFLVRTKKFEPGGETALTEGEKADFKELRWWGLEDIKNSSENFAPRQLAFFMEKLLTDGIPAVPVDVGV